MLAPCPHNTSAEAFLWSSVVNGKSEESDVDTWMLATPLPLMDPCPVSEGMTSDSAGSCSEPETSTDNEESPVQLELFRKLGFSETQVYAVLLKLGECADTNKVLGELVQVGVEPEERNCSGVGVIPHKPHLNPAPAPPQLDSPVNDDALKPIVIDGSNVAMSHGNKEVFSCLGIQLAVNFFLERGHSDITVFVPRWRKEQPRPDVPISDQHILFELEKRKIVVFTPSRRVAGKRMVCYDDRFIVKLAYASDGVIVSNDTYRDLQGENPEWKRFIEERLLMYSFVNDRLMVPDDPLGRQGPTLENFLRKTPRAVKRQPCPYGKKCTYGIKCKFSHPERPKQSNRTLADELREKAKQPAPQTTSHKRSSIGPDHSLLLEELMENNLRLGPREVASKGKAQATENVLVLKDGPPPTSKKPCKKDRSHSHSHSHSHSQSHSQSHNHSHSHNHFYNQNTNSSLSRSSAGMESFPSGSYERLDSGLGSYEQPYPERYHHGDPRKARSTQSTKKQYYPPPPSNGSQSCPCCPLQPPPPVSLAPPTPPPPASLCYPHHIMSSGGSHSSEMSSFALPPFPPYPPNLQRPASLPQHNMACYDPQQPGHSCVPKHGPWSAPYLGGYTHSPQGVHSTGEPVQHHPWGTSMPPPAHSNRPGSHTREEVRKKLMAIFNGRLVDRAMDMFPQLLDPQRLAVEILTLQSQEGNL